MRVTLIQCGGIGLDIVPAVQRIIAAAGVEIAWDEHLAGGAAVARGREPLYGDCQRPEFEATLLRRFQVERKHELPNGRVLYLARRRAG